MTTVAVPATEYSTMTSATVQWLSPYTIPPGSKDKVETHMSLAGGPFGRLSIPDDKHETWLSVYANELEKNRHSLFFAERRTPIFRMHFDLDFCQPDPVDLLLFTALARTCREVFRNFFPHVADDAKMWRCAILVATPKPTTVAPTEEADDGQRVKSGCHMLWPWMYVDQVQALQMRANVVDTLMRTWPPRGGRENSYDDVVDRTVLTSNGLRMMGSDKASRCKHCKKTTRDKCLPCNGTGIITENRPYVLAMVLNHEGEADVERLAAWQNDLFTCVRFTSIRSSRQEHSAGFVVPAHAVTDIHVKNARLRVGQNTRTGTIVAMHEAKGLPGAVAIDSSSPVFTTLAAFVPTVNPAWIGITVSKIMVKRDIGRFTVHVTGPGSAFCTHVNRAHTTSHIYFIVERDGIRQACFSPKVHNGVSCRKYFGPPAQLTQWLQEAMFGREPPPQKTAEMLTTDSILTKSAAFTKSLADRVAMKRKQLETEEATLTALGKKATRRPIGDRGADVMHPVFTDKTCGEVEKMSSMILHQEFLKICAARIAETSMVHAEMTNGGTQPIGRRDTKKKKKISNI